jgi:CPA1 family monovalent cation:H+ antiporter
VLGVAFHAEDLVLLAVLAAVCAMLVASARSNVPYPILLVVGGALLALVPGVAEFELDPDLVLVAFLPPLLYSAAFFGSLQDLRSNVRPITLLAVGLVTATTIVVGVLAHVVIGLPWAAAFVLGAVVSPTDPIAAVEIATRVRAPRRLVTIVEGESLVNDSTGLIAYRFAVAAVVTGTFSLPAAVLEFLLGATGGVLIGIAVGWGVAQVRRRIDDPPVEIAISLITPYLAYLPAEAFELSAVLAAVTSGLYLGWRSPELVTPSTRMQAFAFWEVLVFSANAALFVLVGTQLSAALDALEGYSALELAAYAVVTWIGVTGTRLLWLYPLTYVPRMLLPRIYRDDPAPDPRLVGLLGWSGMRGAVSLAAALAIPLATDAGEPFPGRDLIVFLTFTTILLTVVVQGLTLPRLIDAAALFDDEETVAEQEARARIAAIEAALARLADHDGAPREVHEGVVAFYERRRDRLERQIEGSDGDGDGPVFTVEWSALRRDVLGAERAEIIRLRNRGAITDDTMRRIERDLDLEDTRLGTY